MTKDGRPETLAELCDYIQRHADEIMVRQKIDGHFGPHALTGLPVKVAFAHAFSIIKARCPEVTLLAEERYGDRKRD